MLVFDSEPLDTKSSDGLGRCSVMKSLLELSSEWLWGGLGHLKPFRNHLHHLKTESPCSVPRPAQDQELSRLVCGRHAVPGRDSLRRVHLEGKQGAWAKGGSLLLV